MYIQNSLNALFHRLMPKIKKMIVLFLFLFLFI